MEVLVKLVECLGKSKFPLVRVTILGDWCASVWYIPVDDGGWASLKSMTWHWFGGPWSRCDSKGLWSFQCLSLGPVMQAEDSKAFGAFNDYGDVCH